MIMLLSVKDLKPIKMGTKGGRKRMGIGSISKNLILRHVSFKVPKRQSSSMKLREAWTVVFSLSLPVNYPLKNIIWRAEMDSFCKYFFFHVCQELF